VTSSISTSPVVGAAGSVLSVYGAGSGAEVPHAPSDTTIDSIASSAHRWRRVGGVTLP